MAQRMNRNMRTYICALLIACSCSLQGIIERRPRCYVIFVIDSGAWHYIQKLDPYLTKGIRSLINNGVVFTDAQWPYAIPCTGPGHTGLNTGAFAKDHGVVSNSWFDRAGNKVVFEEDSIENAAVFSPTGVYDYGRSARNIMTCGLSDMFVMQSAPEAHTAAFSISLKPRAAIGTAGAGGKAIWFDDQSGNFTSSKAYFDQLPEWVVEFNKSSGINKLQEFTWDLRYHKNSPAYSYAHIDEYTDTSEPDTIIGKKLCVDRTKKEPYEMFQRTPQAARMIFDLAKECVKANLSRNHADRLLLWICVTPLDKVGHVFGPESKEAIDMWYHTDYLIRDFMRFMHKHCNRLETLYVLTADHGMAYIPEHLKAKKYPHARRIDARQMMPALNKRILEKFGIDLPVRIKAPYVYFGDLYFTLDEKLQKAILLEAKAYFEAQPGIKRAWTNDELNQLQLDLTQIESYYIYQRFPKRSGILFIQAYPMSQFTKYPTGTSHEAPYEWNTHVPLIIYQRGAIEKKIVTQRVWPIQLAPTLAEIMCIPKPTSATLPLLPGILEKVESYI